MQMGIQFYIILSDKYCERFHKRQYIEISLKSFATLKYDSFKKDNRKNCWFQTCLLSSNLIVLINSDSENHGQFILTEQSE